MNQTIEKKKFLPIWIWILVVMEISTPIFFGLLAIHDITIRLPEEGELSYLATLYIARNLIIGVALAIAAFIIRSYPTLFLFIVMRMSMEVSDFSYSYVFNRGEEITSQIPAGIVMFIVIPAIALVVLWPKVVAEHRSARSSG